MRRSRIFGATVFLLVLGGTYLVSADGPPDWHLSSGPWRALCARSAFAHGYMHGYEQGFHFADLDLQMAHQPRDPATIKEFKSVPGYHEEFGDKNFFVSGYREGFRVGYADGAGGFRFRAVGELRAAALGLPGSGDARPSKKFDEGISAGYAAGRQQGLRDGRTGGSFQEVAVQCRGSIYHPFRRSGDEFCAGYGRGFRLGYADGYVNQAPRALAAGGK